jgi:hypothetical protein
MSDHDDRLLQRTMRMAGRELRNRMSVLDRVATKGNRSALIDRAIRRRHPE